MDRKLFLKNALMAVAVSLLPKTLRPVEQLFEAGESPVATYKYPEYKHDRYYKQKMHHGHDVWWSGASLFYMEQWERKRRQMLYDKINHHKNLSS